MDMRSGRRQANLNGNGLCKGKVRKSQRIATLRERYTHPTALRALDLIDKETVDEFERLDVARLHYELLAFEVDDDDDVGGESGDGSDEHVPWTWIATKKRCRATMRTRKATRARTRDKFFSPRFSGFCRPNNFFPGSE